MTKDSIKKLLAEMDLSITARFVPFSHSRNKDNEYKSLNWVVTLRKGKRDVLTIDYSAGQAHCPSYKIKVKDRHDSQLRDERITLECETGYEHKRLNEHMNPHKTRNAIMPELIDVVYSLVSDADVLDSGGFENWAANLGFDSDSRKAEAIYHACVEIAVKLVAAVGHDGIAKLREAYQDY